MTDRSFFTRDVLDVAPELLGKLLCRKTADGSIVKLRISETEAYRGEEDTACHVHKGRTKRTEVFYEEGGILYVYLCYGMHWMLNIVTGQEEEPQAVLIRARAEAPGPGRLTKALGITGELNRYDLCSGGELWLEDDGAPCRWHGEKRVGIGYATPEDQNRLWRFVWDG